MRRILLVVVTACALVGCGSAAPTTETTPGTQTTLGTQTTPTPTESSPESAASTPAPTPLPLLTVDQVRAILGNLRTKMHQVPNTDHATLSCQGAFLKTLRPARVAFREFDGSALSVRVVNTHVATAVMEFGSAGEAAAAYATVHGWLETCPASIRAAHPIRNSPDRPLQDLTIAGGPAALRTLSAAAPEACSECDTGWYDSQGVVLTGKRVVLVSLGSIADLQGPPGPEIKRLLTKAAVIAAD